MTRKVIDPQPILKQLRDMFYSSNGLVRSILGSVIDMLETAPHVTGLFVCVDGIHINTYQIRGFVWKDGELNVWYAGRHFFECWPDQDMKKYLALCYALGVKPAENLRINYEEKEA